MTTSSPGGWLVWVFVAILQGSAWTAELKNRSTSRSGQFIVYCDDRELRSRVVSFSEDLKTDVLQALRETDSWSSQRPPVVVTIDPADPEKPEIPAQVRWTNTIAGPKIDVVVRVGQDPAKVNLQRHLVHAMLLEISYRDRPQPKANEPYANPPWWMIEGILESIRVRQGVAKLDVFKSIVDTQKLPALDRFLTQPPLHLDTTAGAVDRACAMCLVEALLALPNGGANLMRFLQSWPESSGNALGALATHFPVLAGSEQSLAKWWALQLARYANSDRFTGLTLQDTDREVTALLSFEVVVEKSGRKQKYSIQNFESFVKLPGAKSAMQAQQVKVVSLMAKAHPLMRPVLSEYEQIFSLLADRKTRRIAERIAEIEQYRQTVVRQVGQITDYLNWYEATQPVGRTGAFDQYMRKADELNRPQPVDPRITQYLDQLEQDFAPIIPGAVLR